MVEGYIPHWRRRWKRWAYRRWRPTSPISRTKFHSKSLSVQLCNCVWLQRYARGQGCTCGGGIRRDWTWRGCRQRLRRQDRRRWRGMRTGRRQIWSTRQEYNVANIIPQGRRLILPQPMLWVWNSTTKLWVYYGFTEASQRERQIDIQIEREPSSSIIQLNFSGSKFGPPIVCVVDSFTGGLSNTHIIKIPVSLFSLNIAQGLCVPVPQALNEALYTHSFVIYKFLPYQCSLFDVWGGYLCVFLGHTCFYLLFHVSWIVGTHSWDFALLIVIFTCLLLFGRVVVFQFNAFFITNIVADCSRLLPLLLFY